MPMENRREPHPRVAVEGGDKLETVIGFLARETPLPFTAGGCESGDGVVDGGEVVEGGGERVGVAGGDGRGKGVVVVVVGGSSWVKLAASETAVAKRLRTRSFLSTGMETLVLAQRFGSLCLITWYTEHIA